MAQVFKAELKNREKVMARLIATVPEAEKQLAAAQMEAGEDLADRIRSRAPVRTGRYRASIMAARLADMPKKGANAIVAAKTKDKNAVGIYGEFIWRFLEFGTATTEEHKGIAAQPHILPTYRGMKKEIRRRMAKAVNTAVRKARAK